nr:sporulation transcriptional regulator SpoIIID [Roseburia inulinivorans]
MKEIKTLRKKELKRFQIVTTIHKDVTERLEKINASLAAETRKVLDVNKSERHIRGGLATKEKYLHMHGDVHPSIF